MRIIIITRRSLIIFSLTIRRLITRIGGIRIRTMIIIGNSINEFISGSINELIKRSINEKYDKSTNVSINEASR